MSRSLLFMAFNPMPGVLREIFTSYLGKCSPLDKAYDELELCMVDVS